MSQLWAQLRWQRGLYAGSSDWCQCTKVSKGCLKLSYKFQQSISPSASTSRASTSLHPPLACLVRMKTLRQRRGAVSHEFAASSRSNMEAGFCHLGWHPASMHGIGPSNWAWTAKWNHNAHGQRAREESTQLPLRTSDAGELYKCRSNCGPRSWPMSLWLEGLGISTLPVPDFRVVNLRKAEALADDGRLVHPLTLSNFQYEHVWTISPPQSHQFGICIFMIHECSKYTLYSKYQQIPAYIYMGVEVQESWIHGWLDAGYCTMYCDLMSSTSLMLAMMHVSYRWFQFVYTICCTASGQRPNAPETRIVKKGHAVFSTNHHYHWVTYDLRISQPIPKMFNGIVIASRVRGYHRTFTPRKKHEKTVGSRGKAKDWGNRGSSSIAAYKNYLVISWICVESGRVENGCNILI